MLRGHRRFIAVSLAWCFAVILYWRAKVPLVPTRTLEFRDRIVVAGFTQEGELAVCRLPSEPITMDGPRGRGPFEFWSLPEGTKVAETLSSDDLLVSYQMAPTGEAVIKREGKFFVAKVRTGEVISQIPSETSCDSPFVIAKGTRLVYGDGSRLRLFNLDARREAWAFDGTLRWYWRFGPGFVVATRAAEPPGANDPPRLRNVVVLLDLETGQLDHRFEHLGELREVVAAEEYPYAVIATTTKRVVCDALTGKERWQVESSAGLTDFRFEDDGAVVRCESKDDAGNVFIVRWRAADGTELARIPKAQSDVEYRFQVPKSRYAMDSAVVEASWLTKSINERLTKWKLPPDLRFDEKKKVLRVTDLEWNATLGQIPGESGFPILKRDGSGCVIPEDRHVQYFAFPPSRNWVWLLGWALIPPILIRVLGSGFRRIRDRRRRSRQLAGADSPAVRRGPVARVLAGHGRLVVATIVWCAGVFWIWREWVPLSPTWTATFDEPVVAAGVTDAGELVVYRQRAGQVRANEGAHRGPVEFWNLREGRKARETLAAHDHPTSPWSHKSARMVVERNGAYFVVDANTGEVLGPISASAPATAQWITADGGSLIWSDGSRLGRFDFESRREKWVAEGVQSFWGSGSGFVVVIPTTPPPGANRNSAGGFGPTDGFGGGFGAWSGRDYRTCLNFETGQSDTRFDHLGLLSEVMVHKDSRYVLVSPKDKPFTEGPDVCDGRTGAVLWSLPAGYMGSGMFRTENGDTELCIDVGDESGKLHVVRWRAEDGTVISPGPERTWGNAHRFPVAGTRFAVDWVSRRTGHPRWLVWLASNWKATQEWISPSTSKTVVTDVERNVSLGFVASEQVLLQLEPSGAGFAIALEKRIEYYGLPPSRNWWWLVGWGVIPPGLVWGVGGVRRRWRFRGYAGVTSVRDAYARVADARGSRDAFPQG